MTLAGDADAARDLLQQCALQSLASANPPRSEQAVRPWLFRILRNLWIDQHRRDLVRREEAQPALAEQERWHYDDRLIAELTVQKGLARIDPMHREIIRLVDLFGFRYAEVADILDIPLGTVMSRLSRARLALLDAIGGNVRSLESARRRLP